GDVGPSAPRRSRERLERGVEPVRRGLHPAPILRPPGCFDTRVATVFWYPQRLAGVRASAPSSKEVPMRLDGKVTIVTGAGQGIGAATAARMSEAGAKVVVSDVNEQTGNAFVEGIRGRGGEAVFVRTDVSRIEDVKALMAAT